LPVTPAEIRRRFSSIVQWRRGDHRAPHKPLLLLIAIGRLQRDEGRLARYEELEAQLQPLLATYGKKQRPGRASYPFWRLRNDGIWQVPEESELRTNDAGDVSVRDLRREGARGGLTEDVAEALVADADLAREVTGMLLDGSFPPSLHEEILDATGIPWLPIPQRRRDPRFREEVLRIYERRCAVCGYDGRLGHVELGLEAAHVRWFAYGGPDEADNGLALCSFHHHALDRGGIAISPELRVLVSQDVCGNDSVYDWLIRYHGQQLVGPQRGQPPPAAEHLKWHLDEVFRDPPRAL
jgi:putative restriction endonuclease